MIPISVCTCIGNETHVTPETCFLLMEHLINIVIILGGNKMAYREKKIGQKNPVKKYFM